MKNNRKNVFFHGECLCFDFSGFKYAKIRGLADVGRRLESGPVKKNIFSEFFHLMGRGNLGSLGVSPAKSLICFQK